MPHRPRVVQSLMLSEDVCGVGVAHFSLAPESLLPRTPSQLTQLPPTQFTGMGRVLVPFLERGPPHQVRGVG